MIIYYCLPLLFFVCLSVYLFICLSIYLFIYLPIHTHFIIVLILALYIQVAIGETFHASRITML